MTTPYPPIGRRYPDRRIARVRAADPRSLTLTTLQMAAMSTLRILLWTFLILSAVVSLYLIKSAMGINLLAGHSPLHDWFYHIVRP